MTRMTGRRWCSVMGAIALTATLSGCWLMPGYGPDRTGAQTQATAISPGSIGHLAQRWEVDTGDGAVSGVTVSGSGIHATAAPGADGVAVITTLDPGTGSARWTQTRSVPSIGLTSAPYSVGGKVYVGYGVGALGGHWVSESFDPDTGVAGPGADATLPVAARNDVVLGLTLSYGSGGPCWISMRSQDVAAGTGWSQYLYYGDISSCSTGSATLGADAIFHAGRGPMAGTETFTMANGLRRFPLTAAAACSGSPSACPTWSTALDGTTATAPVLGTDGSVFTGTDAGTIYAVDAATGTIRWQSSLWSAVTGPPALAGGMLYVPTASGSLAVLPAAGCSASACSPSWLGTGTDALVGQPAVAGGVVFVADAGGVLRAYDAAGCGWPACAPIWQAALGAKATALAISDDRVVVGTADGRIVTFGL